MLLPGSGPLWVLLQMAGLDPRWCPRKTQQASPTQNSYSSVSGRRGRDASSKSKPPHNSLQEEKKSSLKTTFSSGMLNSELLTGGWAARAMGSKVCSRSGYNKHSWACQKCWCPGGPTGCEAPGPLPSCGALVRPWLSKLQGPLHSLAGVSC